ncbi:MAG: hypothetical protein JWN90_578 [Parcubacteria group bacterium]|nr:hypothetical protein [Parcubacteria group bacterium]
MTDDTENEALRKPLMTVLDDAYNVLGMDLYAELKPRIVAHWLMRNGNDRLVSDVLACHTTFENYLAPLVQANLQITPEKGTPDGFDLLAKATSKIFENIAPLNKWRINIMIPVQPQALLSRMMFSFAPLCMLMIAAVGGLIGTVFGGTLIVIIAAIAGAALGLLLWWQARRTFWNIWCKSLEERKTFAQSLLEDMTQLSIDLQLAASV